MACAPNSFAVNVSTANNHVDVMPYASDGSIAAGFFDYDTQQVVEDTRAFVRELELLNNPASPTIYATQNPGFTTLDTFTLPANEELTFTVPTIVGSDGVSRNLLYWDGEGVPDFGAPLPGEDLFLRRSDSNNALLDGSSSPVDGFTISEINADGDMHRHFTFFVRSNDAGHPGDGFYLFAMHFMAGDLESSEPVFFMFNADYERGEEGQILFNGSRPILNKDSELLATDWLLSNLLAPAVPGDADGDGDVDDTDLGVAISNFTGPVGASGGKSAAQGDTDDDGDVDDTDLGVAISGFTGPLAPALVPEPASIGTFVLAGLLLIRRKRPAG